MGCCNLKNLPGVNESNDRFSGSKGKEHQDNADDMYIIENSIKSYNQKIGTKNKKFEFTYEVRDGEDDTRNDLQDDDNNLMSNRDIVFKIRDSDPKKTYHCLRSTKTSDNLFNNRSGFNNAFKKGFRSKCVVFDDAENVFRIKIKLEFFSLCLPHFFSYFNFEFLNDFVPEIVLELKEFKKVFTGVRFNENGNSALADSNEKNVNLNKSINDDKNNCFINLRRVSTKLLGKNDKAIKMNKFTFEENVFEAEQSFVNLKNSFICLYLFAKNTKGDLNPYLIGEAFLPINYLIFHFDFFENILDVPIINKTENVILGTLTLDLRTSESTIKTASDLDLQTSKKYFENYFKSNNLSIDFYERLNLQNSNFNFNFFIFNNIKVKINNYIKKFSETLQKKQALKDLVNYLSEKDLNRTKDSILNQESTKSINSAENPNEKEKLLKIDRISYTKYYGLLCLLNDYLTESLEKQKNLSTADKKTPKKPELDFLNDKIIYSPFLEIHQFESSEDQEFDLMLLTNAMFTFIATMHKANFVQVESNYADCVFILRDLGSLFAKSKSFLVRLQKEEIKNNQQNNNQNSIVNKIDPFYNILGMKHDSYYALILDNIYKYLFIVNSTIDLYVKSLREDPEKTKIAKNEIRFATLKSNYEFFVFANPIFTNDIFIANSSLNIFLNIAKYGKLYSSIHRLNKIECYANFFSDIFSNNSDFFKDLFVRFNSSHIFFKSYVELGEIITNGSPTYIKFNFLKTINFKLLMQRFNIEAKGIESKKFLFWNSYLNLLLNTLASFAYDHLEMIDFFVFNHFDFVIHFAGLFTITSNYPYFKIFSQNEISFDLEKLLIICGNPEINLGGASPTSISTISFNVSSVSSNNVGLSKKFLGTFQSLLVFSSFLDIFYEIILRKYLLNVFIQKYKNTFMAIFEKIVFVVFYNVEIYDDKHKSDIRIKLFNIYTRIMRILYKMQVKYNFSLQSFVKESFKNIFKKENKDVKVSHLLQKLMLRINEFKQEKSEKGDNKAETKDSKVNKELAMYTEMAGEINKQLNG